MIVNFKKLNEEAKKPSRAHDSDAGNDLYSTEYCLIPPGATRLVGTGVAFELPDSHYGQVASRSGLASKGIFTIGGVVDSSYRGEVKVIMHNSSVETFEVQKGMKIAQLIIVAIAHPTLHEVTELDDSKRGSSGFGSSGV